MTKYVAVFDLPDEGYVCWSCPIQHGEGCDLQPDGGETDSWDSLSANCPLVKESDYQTTQNPWRRIDDVEGLTGLSNGDALLLCKKGELRLGLYAGGGINSPIANPTHYMVIPEVPNETD